MMNDKTLVTISDAGAGKIRLRFMTAGPCHASGFDGLERWMSYGLGIVPVRSYNGRSLSLELDIPAVQLIFKDNRGK